MSHYRATNQITNHEEIRNTLLDDLNGSGRADEVAELLHIGVSTARRYLDQMVQRGWAHKSAAHGKAGYHNSFDYTIDPDCAEEDW
ncbi:MAG: helix-turn-helix domain-containing protein [Mycolicibacterium sp.]|uniref:helix-turn-helix domain-containing protein n=1 Tax=Mycolicibacterium sp. TaxID=2320850 RepID=UPI003D097DBF